MNTSGVTQRLAATMALGVLTCLPLPPAHGAAADGAGSWSELGPLNIGRYGCKAFAIDADRAIVLAGFGDRQGSADSSVELLDVTTGRWTMKASMPPGFVPGAIAWAAKLENEYFLVAGGLNALRTLDFASYVYSASTDRWIRTGDMPSGASLVSNFGQISAVVLNDGRVLVASGLGAPSGAETTASLLFTPDYDGLARGAVGAAAGTWDFTRDRAGRVTRMNGASEHHKLVKLRDGRVLVIHGNDRRYVFGVNEFYRDTHGVQAELFDPKRGTWTKLPDLPAIPGEDDRHDGTKGVRQLAAASLLPDGRVLVSGGFSSPGDAKGRPVLKSILYVRSSSIVFDPARFDLGLDPWSITGSMAVARHSHSHGLLPGTRGTISVGGFTDDAWTARTEIYDPAAGTWKSGPSMPAAHDRDLPFSQPWGCTAVTPSGGILVAGGVIDVETGFVSRRTYLYRP